MNYLILAILGCIFLAANYTCDIVFAGKYNMSSLNTSMTAVTWQILLVLISDTLATQTDIREGMNSLKNNDTQSAIDHFNSAVNLSNSSSTVDVISNLRQGIEALESGDRGSLGWLEMATKLNRGPIKPYNMYESNSKEFGKIAA
mgnify:CR=1 FL=1